MSTSMISSRRFQTTLQNLQECLNVFNFKNQPIDSEEEYDAAHDLISEMLEFCRDSDLIKEMYEDGYCSGFRIADDQEIDEFLEKLKS